MKIKFVTPDLAQFTGMYGAVEFNDGVSVNHVSDAEVRLYGAITTIEVIGDDFTPEKSYDDIKDLAAVSCSLPTLADLAAQEPSDVSEDVVEPAETVPGVAYTQAELEEIADKQGIAGVRDIAETMNIRGTSISKLISAILAAQTPVAPVDFIEAPAEAVTLTMTDSLVEQEA